MGDIMCLAGGTIAAVIEKKTQHHPMMLLWFGISSFFYLTMMATLHTDVAHTTVLDQTPEVQRLFSQLQVLTVCTWTGYPIVVFLGRAHGGVITKSLEDLLICILDVISKIGMEGLIVATCSVSGVECHPSDH